MGGYSIDTLPAGSVIESFEQNGHLFEYRVLLPDGSRQFVTVIMGHPVKVIKTVHPPDSAIEISVGEAKERR
jgi:hypothetical protein